MHPSHASPSGDIIDAGLPRQMLAFMLAGILTWIVVSTALAEPLIPAADTGGGGGRAPTVSEMLRGAYSPVDAAPEIAVTEVATELTVAEMLRGAYSPIEAAPEIAVTEAEAAHTVDEMLRGDLSPISFVAV